MSAGLSVPIEMFLEGQKQSYGRKLRVFLCLKLLYKSGKTKLREKDLLFLELVEQIRTRKTTLNYIQFFIKKGWIHYNARTGYYILKSFDRIRMENNWKVRLAFPVTFKNYQNIKAITGAVLYGYLHKDFWRKVRRRKSVQIKGSTYHFLSPNFNYQEAAAPISLSGINKIFGLSVPTASRLKARAGSQELIKITKNYGSVIPHRRAMELCLKYNELENNLVFHQGEYRLQLIDTILPLFLFTKRKKLKA
jgi:hypothetical protein